VNHVHHRLAAAGVEVGWIGQPHLHRLSQRALQHDGFAAAHLQFGQVVVVEALEPARRLIGAQHEQLRRMALAVLQRDEGRRRGRAGHVKGLHPAAGGDRLEVPADRRRAAAGAGFGFKAAAPQRTTPLVLGAHQQRLAARRPAQGRRNLVVPVGAERIPSRAPGRSLGHAACRAALSFCPRRPAGSIGQVDHRRHAGHRVVQTDM
jgi:hypothetical protein